MTETPLLQLSLLKGEIDKLRKAITALAGVPEAQRQLRGQLLQKELRLQALQFSGAARAVGGSTDGAAPPPPPPGNRSDIVAEEDSTPDPNRLLHEYLLNLSGICNRLSLADADSSDPTRAAVELNAVYTRLEVASVVPLSQEEQRHRLPGSLHRQRSALETLAASPRLVLVGEPGSGKSTFVNYIGLCLARAYVGDSAWRARLGDGWPLQIALPVRVVLREFAAWIASRPTRPARGDVRLFWLWLTYQHGKMLAAQLRREITGGRAMILLDGLDEVPTDKEGQPLALVRQTIESLAKAAGSSRMLLTCRVLDYGQSRRQIPGWPIERLIPFNSDLCQEFIGRWYDVLARLARPMNGDPVTLQRRLRAEVRDRPALRRLAGNPLLLTMITLLHAYEGRLPEERVRVYEKCVEFLLYRWRAQAGDASLGERLNLPRWSESDLARLLDRLGFVAHTRGTSGDGESGADLPREVLLETARSFFAPYGLQQSDERAREFCTYISRYSNGVLQQYGDDIYRFPHRTFQEYLAARRLVSDDDWPDSESEFVDRILHRADERIQWREALLLAVSQQIVVGKQIVPAAVLVERLLNRYTPGSVHWAHDIILAGEALAEVGRERLDRLGTRRSLLWERVTSGLLELIGLTNGASQPLLPLAERVRAGQALGRLGDPRLPVNIEQWRRAARGRTKRFGERPHIGVLDDHIDSYFCYVRSGIYATRSGPKERRVALQPFWIGRLPVTIAQYAPFVQVGYGPEGERWWTAEGWQWKRTNMQPWLWMRSDYNGENQPVIGVTWYEAVAFANYLTEQLAGALPTGYVVRLPTEAEWEAAASYDGAMRRRRFPWGNDMPTVERAIHLLCRLDRSAPVGMCPQGAAACGALDMAGNVWEWTTSTDRSIDPLVISAEQRKRLQSVDQTVLEGSHFALRGGSHRTDGSWLRCVAERRFHPGSDLDFGFRLVIGPKTG